MSKHNKPKPPVFSSRPSSINNIIGKTQITPLKNNYNNNQTPNDTFNQNYNQNYNQNDDNWYNYNEQLFNNNNPNKCEKPNKDSHNIKYLLDRINNIESILNDCTLKKKIEENENDIKKLGCYVKKISNKISNIDNKLKKIQNHNSESNNNCCSSCDDNKGQPHTTISSIPICIKGFALNLHINIFSIGDYVEVYGMYKITNFKVIDTENSICLCDRKIDLHKNYVMGSLSIMVHCNGTKYTGTIYSTDDTIKYIISNRPIIPIGLSLNVVLLINFKIIKKNC